MYTTLQNGMFKFVQITKYEYIYQTLLVTLAVIVGTSILVPYLPSHHYNSFEDRAPVDEIYGCPVFQWVTETWPYDWVPG